MRPTSLFLAFALLSVTPALAQDCQDPGAFPTWLEQFKQEAATQGISEQTIASSLAGVTRVNKGQAMLTRYADVLTRIEAQFGVQGPVLVAIWALETDFGANIGKMATVRSLATLAFDCRRQAHFHEELLDALRIIDRGDMPPSAMRGAWAGELGQTQFLASSYVKFAVDFDGDGRRDLLTSTPDVLASTANYLHGYGWQPGASWEPGGPNFEVIKQWNKSDIYSKTIALLATRIASASTQ